MVITIFQSVLVGLSALSCITLPVNSFAFDPASTLAKRETCLSKYATAPAGTQYLGLVTLSIPSEQGVTNKLNNKWGEQEVETSISLTGDSPPKASVQFQASVNNGGSLFIKPVSHPGAPLMVDRAGSCTNTYEPYVLPSQISFQFYLLPK
ncbi:hypothetical protein Ptr902_04405 [Pyrenophora tritici-repentis]|uniref:Uncharacterized protein n=1 Tax=Pyrenophora tritici-repentis TaxID=45151 RepID=A0A5M9L431_9PLEO|nr:hypothetical protein PtrV1_07032 [Pyrenophora tritici-repentis]KAF7448083.1 hypothetical protein A1F99_074470 [Pyrenophora tritici-repentis]KAF7571787.1 hypothetical protein PtrM4_092870 [Pyrenophora tritici-repentis]KAI0578041.1 hypothetical protein Alg215_06547 [Pyrenophora tritici-repentis]KAI0582781.1 hypothetical protein Alg130_06013 [Pyrenophora tritici-repentis]